MRKHANKISFKNEVKARRNFIHRRFLQDEKVALNSSFKTFFASHVCHSLVWIRIFHQ